VSDERNGSPPPGATVEGTFPFRFERPPQRRNGYDVEATDALLGQFSDRCRALAGECASLREQVAQLEAELSRGRVREQSVSDALIAAKQHAEAIVDDARREAEEILGKARAGAEERAALDRVEDERAEVERELERLRRIQREVHSGLTAFLLEAVELVQSEEDDEAAVPAPVADGSTWVDSLEAGFRPESIG
jgi:cell division septum initiation protein DivIVA